jgi:hypothetical protein
VPATESEPAWRPWPEGPSPEAVFCFHYPRRVANDATVPWDGRALALPASVAGGWRGRSVVLQERLDESLWANRGDVCVPLVQAPDTAPVLRARRLARPTRAPELLPAPEPVDPDPQAQPPSAASASKAERRHPWRLYPAVRPKPR